MRRSSKCSLSLRFPYHNPVSTSPLPCTCYMPRSPHSSWFDKPNNIWCPVQIVNLLFLWSFSLPCYLVPLCPKFTPPQLPILEHPQPVFVSQREGPGCTSLANSRQNYSVIGPQTVYFRSSVTVIVVENNNVGRALKFCDLQYNTAVKNQMLKGIFILCIEKLSLLLSTFQLYSCSLWCHVITVNRYSEVLFLDERGTRVEKVTRYWRLFTASRFLCRVMAPGGCEVFCGAADTCHRSTNT
jgi:hypothetical protein